MAQAFDAVIIGAGIMGCSTAFQLSKRGLKVAVLEKGSIGSGSSGKSSAIIRQHYSNEITALMALRSLRTFQDFDQLVGGECGFTQTGFLALTPAKDVEGLKQNVALHQRVGIQAEILPVEELRKMWPMLEASDLVAAAYEPESGFADPNLTVNGYAAAAKRHGAGLFLDTTVTAIRMGAGRVQGVDSTRGSFDAPVVINCSGAWGARVAQMAGVEVPINSCRVQVGFFRRPAGYEAPHPVVADFTHGAYWRHETGALTLIGLIDPAEAEAIVDPDNYPENVDLDFMADAGDRLVRRFPAMEASDSAGGYAALYGITPDWHPVMDEVPAGSGFYQCAGFSGHGFKLGPAVGEMTADMVLGVETPELSWSAFRLSRFAEGEPVQGQYEYSIVG